MDAIVVTASPEKAAVLPGESLVVKSTVQNRGGASMTVPSEHSASPLSYRLQPDGPPERAPYEVSAQTYHDQTRIGLAPRTPIIMNEDLAPGGTQIRSEDVALFSAQPFLPGKYRLTAAWTVGNDQSISGFTRVAVSEPKIEVWSSEVCRRTEQLRTVFVHRREDGEAVIYERESGSNRPQFGVFRPRIRLAKGTTVQSVAPAVVLDDSGQGNWMAWIVDGKLNVAGVLAHQVIGQPPAQPVGVRNPHFAGPGFHVGPERAVFFVAGESNNGTVLELWGVTRTELRRAWQLPLGKADGKIRILARKEGTSSRFITIFEERTENNGARLWRKDFNLRGDAGTPATQLAQFPLPLLAWNIEPTDYPIQSRLAVLHRAEKNDATVLQARTVDLDGKGPSEPAPLPRLVAGSAPDLWTILWFHNHLHVATRNAGRILYGEPGWSEWKDIGTVAAGPGWIHLFSPHSIKLWAEWSVANRGPVREQLMQAGVEE